jgi:hypothetical protein
MFTRITTGLAVLAITSVAFGQGGFKIRSGHPVSHNLPPAQMLMEPGPGVGGPGPGVLAPAAYMGGGYGMGGMPGGGMGPAPAISNVIQVLFDRPEGMNINWDVTAVGMYDSTTLFVPGRQNFLQGAIYRLKISSIEGRPGLELYPTLEIGPPSSRTAAYLAHAAVPIQFNQEDFDQVSAGNFVTKVIYVPDPEYQELALAGVDTLVSTRLDPGIDPIVEADRRGSILAIIRIGNKDLQGAGTAGGFAGMNPGMGGMGGASGMSGTYISGVTGPNYGMPWTGTQIGLPGPPHIPLGGPAGLQNYTMHNHTAMSIPGPTPRVNVHVKQQPGLSYPRPADTVLIQENTIRPPHYNQQPPADMVHGMVPADCNTQGSGVLGRVRR